MSGDMGVEIIVYLLEPFALDREPKIYILNKSGAFRSISIEDLSKRKKTLVTYDWHSLVPYFRRRNCLPPREIIDICQVGKLLLGDPEKKKRENYFWIVLNDLFPNWEGLVSIQKILHGGGKIGGLEFPEKLLEEFSFKVRFLWEGFEKELSEKGELERFTKVEKPIQGILIDREYFGIRVDNKFFSKYLSDIDFEFAKVSKILRDRWGIYDIKDRDKLKSVLENEGFLYLADNVGRRLFNDLLEISNPDCELVDCVKKAMSLRKEKTLILRFGTIGEKRVFPEFDLMGTVSGRILVSQPLIQNIKKGARKLIVADKDYVFLYPDYKQFEPGILAFESNDASLIEMYNRGDVYCELSQSLFGTSEKREISKKVFLAFSYGMNKSGLAKLLSESWGFSRDEASIKIDKFFQEFSGLDDWKKGLFDSFKVESGVSSRLGNYRWRNSPSSSIISNAEKRWVVSQRIQGTASLILKKAILNVYRKIPEAEFVVPMHDAVLYQVPIKKENEIKHLIEGIFIKSFKNECPSIVPRINFSSFYEN